MSKWGKQLSWAVMGGATLFIAGYLLKHGETAYGDNQPAAVTAPTPTPAATAAPAPSAAPESPPEGQPTTKVAREPSAPTAVPTDQPAAPAKPDDKPKAPPPVAATPVASVGLDPQPVATPPQLEPPSPLPVAAPVPKKEPRIKFQQPVFDFGTLFQDEKITHDYIFENEGQAPLKIQKVTSSCGCTVTKLPQEEIAPGKKGAIKVTFESGKMRDRVTKHIYVTSNDPVTPRTTLTITGEIKVEAEVQPSGIYFGAIKPGETVTRSVVIRPVAVKALKILEAKSSDAAIAVAKLAPAGKPEPEGSYRVTITVGPVTEARRINATLVMRTDLPHQKEIKVPVYGRVTAEQAALRLQPEEGDDPASAPQ